VAGIDRLDAAARTRGVLVASGASTVPALSAAVVDHLRPSFGRIESIDCGISPGNRSERGIATVAAILSTVGRPLQIWQDQRWRETHGWQALRRWRYPGPVGRRWLSTCDVPDLALFPARYGADTVRFGAGLELSFLHLGLWVLSWLRRAGIVSDWARFAPELRRMSEWLAGFGSNAGAMHLALRGLDVSGRARRVVWTLTATAGDGPEVPCTPAVVLAGKLKDGKLAWRGARPCLDLVTLAELEVGWSGFAIATTHNE
jgi:hypothetical protein